MARKLAVRAGHARGHARRRARRVALARTGGAVLRRPARRAQRLEPFAHLVGGLVELHGHTRRRTQPRHLGRDLVNDLSGERDLLAAEAEKQLHLHARAQLEQLVAGDEDPAVHEVRRVLALERLGALEAHRQDAFGPGHTHPPALRLSADRGIRLTAPSDALEVALALDVA